MYCPYCGKEIPDGAKFCGHCGKPVSVSASGNGEKKPHNGTGDAAGRIPDRARAAVQGGASGRGRTPDQAASGRGRTPDQAASKKSPGPSGEGRRNLPVLPIIIAAAVVVIIIILAAVLLVGRGGGSSGSKVYAYLSGGKYELITDLAGGDAVELASSKSDYALPSLVSFSPDGKYIYYYTKVDTSYYTGTLCRAQISKLKAGSSKNEDYIDTISSNVTLGLRMLEDGTVLFLKDDTLYSYDGSEPAQLARSVNYYYADDAGRVIYGTGDYSEGYTLYGLSLSSPDDKIKLAANYSSICDVTDFDNIFYTKTDEDGSSTLYVAGFDRDAEKLGKNAVFLGSVDGTQLFVAESTETVNLYDYVQDDSAESEAGLTEPDLEDYQTLEYSYVQLYSDDDIQELGTLYTTCTQNTYFWKYSMSYKAGYSSDETVKQACTDFINKYQSQENDDGYLEVTDAVKEDLISMAQTCGQGYDNEWQEFCFAYEPTGYTYDYDKYDADVEAYDAVADRAELREALQDPDNALPLYTIWQYKDGNLTALAENVLDMDDYSGAYLFNTLDSITEKISISKISSAYDVEEFFELDYGGQNDLLTTADGSVSIAQLSSSAADDMDAAYEESYIDLYATAAAVFMEDGNGSLYAAQITDGVAGDFTLISDEAEVCGLDGSTLYYAVGSYGRGGYTYCDLYSYDGGQNRRLAADIMADSAEIYDDGVILAYTDAGSYGGYELSRIDSDGTRTTIADEVTQYIRVSSGTILYISDDDLCVYDGKEKTVLNRNVQWVWAESSVTPAVDLSYSSLYGNSGY